MKLLEMYNVTNTVEPRWYAHQRAKSCSYKCTAILHAGPKEIGCYNEVVVRRGGLFLKCSSRSTTRVTPFHS